MILISVIVCVACAGGGYVLYWAATGGEQSAAIEIGSDAYGKGTTEKIVLKDAIVGV